MYIRLPKFLSSDVAMWMAIAIGMEFRKRKFINLGLFFDLCPLQCQENLVDRTEFLGTHIELKIRYC